MSKKVKLYYNGEAGWGATIDAVKEFYKITKETTEWLEEKDDFDITNSQKILEGHTQRARFLLGFEDEEGNEVKTFDEIIPSMPMSWPVELHINADEIQRDLIINQSNLIKQNDSFGEPGYDPDRPYRSIVYASDFYKEIIRRNLRTHYSWKKNGFYAPSLEGNGEIISGIRNSTYKKEKPSIRVWAWCKALMGEGGFNKNSVFDLTPFLQSVSTNMIEGGGSFSITLPNVMGTIDCKLNEDGESSPSGTWRPDKTSYYKYFENGIENFSFKTNINKVSEINIKSRRGEDRFQNVFWDGEINIEDDRSKEFLGTKDFSFLRNIPLFHMLLSENDVIFISFNDLEEVEKYDDFFISVDEIEGKNWDMIALIDTNGSNFSAESDDVNVQIAGRDLMKLLIEDGTFFFQKSYSNPDQKDTAFNNEDLPNRGDGVNSLNNVTDDSSMKGINRLITTGLIETLYNSEARNVGYVMNLLISRLSNIEICPSEVFDSYGEKKTRFQVVTEEEVEKKNDLEDNLQKELE